jgi:hypothetical protein
MHNSDGRLRLAKQREKLAAQISRWRRTGEWVCLSDLADWRASAGADGIQRVHHGCQQVTLAILDHKAKIARAASMLIIANGAKAETATATDLEQIEASPQYQLPDGLDAMMYLLTQCWMCRDAIIDLANTCKWRDVEKFLEQQAANARRSSPPPIQGKLVRDVMQILQEPGAIACVNATARKDYVKRRLIEMGYKKNAGDLTRTIQRASKALRSENS